MTPSFTKGQEVYFIENGKAIMATIVRPTPDSDGDIVISTEGRPRGTQRYIHLSEVKPKTELAPAPPTPSSYDKFYAEACLGMEVEDKFTETNKETETMNEAQASRSVVNVTLIDTDAGLKPENSVVANLGQFVVENSNYDHVKQRILMDTKLDIAGKLAEHNKMRETTVDLEVLKRTGNKVKLQPVEIFQLEWSFK